MSERADVLGLCLRLLAHMWGCVAVIAGIVMSIGLVVFPWYREPVAALVCGLAGVALSLLGARLVIWGNEL